jgi:hypothetical protein
MLDIIFSPQKPKHLHGFWRIGRLEFDGSLSTFRGHVVIGQIGPLWGSTKREMQLARSL